MTNTLLIKGSLMKSFLLLGLFIISLQSFALEKYTIAKGSIHKGGWITVVASEVGEMALIKINYEVKKKIFIPGFVKKYLKGEHTQKLPKSFLYETAYLDLEKDKILDIGEARVVHEGRASIGRYKDCHKIKIMPKNGKSEMTAYYHPQVGDAGWVHISLTIKKIPVMGNYNLTADLDN
jgi:hypothetical protein